MASKTLVFVALIAAAKAGNLISAPLAAAPFAAAIQPAPFAYHAPIAKLASPVAYAAPVAKAVVAEEYDPQPQYSYGYEVHDSLTGDSKSQIESRNGDVVQGSYSVVDPDGTKRTVDYIADPVNGFNAVVRKEALVAKAVVASPAIAKVAAPIAYPVAKIAAPVTYTAPVSKLSAPLAYAAPISKIAAPLAYSTSILH